MWLWLRRGLYAVRLAISGKVVVRVMVMCKRLKVARRLSGRCCREVAAYVRAARARYKGAAKHMAQARVAEGVMWKR